MKEAIEKAIKNGFKLTDIFSNGAKGIKITSWHADPQTLYINFTYKTHGTYRATYHELIFGTDFVDKLVGEGEFDKNKCKCKAKNLCSLCNKDKYTIADFHRREMANIKDIDKLKDYIRGLI